MSVVTLIPNHLDLSFESTLWPPYVELSYHGREDCEPTRDSIKGNAHPSPSWFLTNQFFFDVSLSSRLFLLDIPFNGGIKVSIVQEAEVVLLLFLTRLVSTLPTRQGTPCSSLTQLGSDFESKFTMT